MSGAYIEFQHLRVYHGVSWLATTIFELAQLHGQVNIDPPTYDNSAPFCFGLGSGPRRAHDLNAEATCLKTTASARYRNTSLFGCGAPRHSRPERIVKEHNNNPQANFPTPSATGQSRHPLCRLQKKTRTALAGSDLLRERGQAHRVPPHHSVHRRGHPSAILLGRAHMETRRSH